MSASTCSRAVYLSTRVENQDFWLPASPKDGSLGVTTASLVSAEGAHFCLGASRVILVLLQSKPPRHQLCGSLSTISVEAMSNTQPVEE